VIVVRSEVVTVRFDSKERKEIDEVAQKKMASQSEVIRKATLIYLQKEKEIDEIKRIVAHRFAQGKISFDDLVRILGYEESKKTAFFVETAEKSFQEGL